MHLVWIAPDGTAPPDVLQDALAAHAAALELPADALRIRDVQAWSPQPHDVVLYWHSDAPGPSGLDAATVERRLDQARDQRCPIVAVVRNPKAAGSLPTSLKGLNAFIRSRYQRGWPQSLADELLTLLWLYRRKKRVFISYKRTDSEAIAKQIHDALVRIGYETFLDTRSIAVSAEVQEQIHAELIDSDLMLLLHSPHLTDSTWVMEEVNAAHRAGIGVLSLRWPGISGRNTIAAAIQEFEQFQLQESDLIGASTSPDHRRLRHTSLRKILNSIAEKRVRMTVRRVQDLMPYAIKQYSAHHSVTPLPRLGDLKLEPQSADTPPAHAHARVMPFRPGADVVHGYYREAQGHALQPTELRCFYQESTLQHPILQALQWMLAPQQVPGYPPPRVFLDPYVGSHR